MNNTLVIQEQEINNFFKVVNSINVLQENGFILEMDNSKKKIFKDKAIAILTKVKEKLLALVKWIKEHLIDKVIAGGKKFWAKISRVDLKKLKDKAIESAKEKDTSAVGESGDLYRYLLTESSTFEKIQDFLDQETMLLDKRWTRKIIDLLRLGEDDNDYFIGNADFYWSEYTYTKLFAKNEYKVTYELYINDCNIYDEFIDTFNASSLKNVVNSLEKKINELTKQIEDVNNVDISKINDIRDLLNFTKDKQKGMEHELYNYKDNYTDMFAFLNICENLYRYCLKSKEEAIIFLNSIKRNK